MIEDAGAPGTRARPPAPQSPGWTMVLPLKGGPKAKSRLAAPAALATAIALDCLDAVLATPAVSRVVVVTADALLTGSATAAGAEVRGESRPGSGLLAAIEDGLRGLEGPCAVLLGDLPALRPADLDLALQSASQALTTSPPSRRTAPDMVFVPDADGIGTVLLAAREPGRMRPSFGPSSARKHAESGALKLELDLPALRRDVDTQADLRAAAALGLGPRTGALLQDGAISPG
ncbi:2-phospho-L-lactate guanylyltransferase [Kineosporia babensis]|uniref:2-phospho-L-lactate guanylyltransferase n=1 Tax=Kineosporia babensis TaxID=499548 RepID=A0A9X1NGS2_9ACTN|nr:2-phospho-L-lactate guanylyltransferase [Kineosporia babensis]MCD5313745.1 2-phospho-L-lactate guanylyltransferase [Kineosporia babensis]